jgi:hypothetical protein
MSKTSPSPLKRIEKWIPFGDGITPDTLEVYFEAKGIVERLKEIRIQLHNVNKDKSAMGYLALIELITEMETRRKEE